jgi:hypothetical protein
MTGFVIDLIMLPEAIFGDTLAFSVETWTCILRFVGVLRKFYEKRAQVLQPVAILNAIL